MRRLARRFRIRASGNYAAMNAHTIARWTRHPVRAVEDEAKHLHEIELEGENAATPLLSIASVGMFLLPVIVVVMGTALALYYLV
jgi:hypothetical protein